MFMDTSKPGAPGGEPWLPSCPGCRNRIVPGQPVETIRFHAHDPHGLGSMTAPIMPNARARS